MIPFLAAALRFGLKPLKYFIDNTFRDKVTPVEGSVLYCDLWVAAEHSGIYVGNGQISNIVVDGVAESTVQRSDARDFTSKSTMGNKIYVSCNDSGAVGNTHVAGGADSAVGQRSFYGLVFKNCHAFSTRCVNLAHFANHAAVEEGLVDWVINKITPEETWEPTIRALKETAEKKLGANKWRLWDWENQNNSKSQSKPDPEPDWQAHHDHFMNQPLNAQSIQTIREQFTATQAYEAEIANENIPDAIRQKLAQFRILLGDISQKYEEVKNFLAQCAGADFSYSDLKACTDDFSALARELQNNRAIHELARKMGRDYISEEKKKQSKIPEASKSEVYGTHRSDDLMRILPSELLYLEDETLETLFYAKLLEQSLQTYQLKGITYRQGEEIDRQQKRTGPVVACLDTSGSMNGLPLLKAKALLLAIANILKKENRALHVILFGASGELREFSMESAKNTRGLLAFLNQGFGGGTDFETPLKKSLHIIENKKDCIKADILMISDGDCCLSSAFAQKLQQEKSRLDCSVYSVLCAGQRVADSFSDEVVVLS